MNWGYRIVILFSGFATLMIFMVITAFRQNIDLVSEDYYAKEIKYQEQIGKLENANHLKDKISFVQEGDVLILSFKEAINIQSGEILFFRPSDQKKDLKENLMLDNKQEQRFERKKFFPGYYKVQIDWLAEGKKYYVEKDIFIQ
jgi:hypothetical protein